ncbi:NADH-quinone oxidoreductase subunit A [Catalinimonas sp. 4WD22]|uniref:NADH-quinone oxidoreductase subunit A n=1 Tax=Catalinimonas locisalis TaxID=3133978 RepID=UPI003100EB8E
MQDTQLSAFSIILLFIVGSSIFVAIALLTARMIRPDRPNEEKLTTYECGEDPSGSAWGQFNSRFYIIALIFLLFDVEIVFLFPWATIFGQKELIDGTQGLWGWFSLIEMSIFIGILAMGLAYAWAKGFLDWIKPKVSKPTYTSHIPKELYDKVSEKY